MTIRKTLTIFILDIIILILFILLAINGLLMQKIYHLDHNAPTFAFLWFDKNGWLFMHKIISVLLSIGIFFHLIRHIKWLKDIFKNKRLFQRSYKKKLLIILCLVFSISAISGFISWFFNNQIIGYNAEIRHILIEIHDKLTLLLIILFLIHFIKKIKWFINTSKQF